MVVEVALAEHPIKAGSWTMRFTIGSSVVGGDVVTGAYLSDLQSQLTVIAKLYDEIPADVAVAVQVGVGWLSGRTNFLVL